MLASWIRSRASQKLQLAVCSHVRKLQIAAVQAAAARDVKPFYYQDILELEKEAETPWKKLTDSYVSTFEVKGKKVLQVEPAALTLLAEQAMVDLAHLLRPGHLQQLSNILKDPEASSNDKFVALEYLKNANVAAGMVLPGCQDTGTAICIGKKGQYVWTEGKDEEALSRGIYNTYTNRNLRYSQVAPLDMYQEVNTKTNLPAQIELYATNSSQYDFLFLAKGGGSANKSFLYQQTKALLNPEKLLDFVNEKIKKTFSPDSYVSTFEVKGKKVLQVEPAALTLLAEQAMVDLAHLLRPGHLQQLSNILKDPEASSNDKFVALEYLKNANVAAGMVLPGCQDTGTAICIGKKGQYVWTEGKDEEALSRGIYNTYTNRNLRYSQVAPLDMYQEVNTKTNLPAQIELYATNSSQYDFLFLAKGGGSANKSFLYQQTKALLNPEKLLDFVNEKIKTLGTAACPPYHLAIVIGGTSAEYTLKTVKLASTRYLDTLPTSGNEHGRGFRDVELEKEIHKLTQNTGMGAQFGGKYFCHDVRVVRLPRHGASCPVGIGVSCGADRQALGKITEEGVFLEQLETQPYKYLPEVETKDLGGEVIKVDLNRPMEQVLQQLDKYPIRTRLSLTGTLIVARDIAHAKLQERLDKGEGLPQYMKDHPLYYAGPAKTPEGYVSGSFGPTSAGRMDSYVDTFQAEGGLKIMLAKGNRSRLVTKACKTHGGFYLGSIGGPAALLAQDCIKEVELLEYPELGMEAIWRIKVENFPAFIIVDNKGNDFFKEWQVE